MTHCYNCMSIIEAGITSCPDCGQVTTGYNQEPYYLQEGTALNDRYIIGKVLGHGGFGITYIGYDNQLQVKVAIKEYLPSDFATRQEGTAIIKTYTGENEEQFRFGLKRFLDEARTLAKFNDHPCIVSTTNYFEANGTAYIVMEYLEGISLGEYVKRKGGKLGFDETVKIMQPVMDALKEVHKDGIIHRDISPDNIYITKKGMVKVIDFGAARYAMGEKSKSLSVILKPGYAPPEQYSSRGKQGPWTDIYAVAATIYKIVHGEGLLEAVDRLKETEIRYASSISRGMQNVLTKALAVEPASRYQSMEAFQSAISKPAQAAVSDKEIEQINKGHKTVVVKSNKRTKLFAGISIALVIVLIVTIIAIRNRPVVYQSVTYNITSDKKINYDNALIINPANDAFDGEGRFEVVYVDAEDFDFVEDEGLHFISTPIEIEADYEENEDRDRTESMFEVTLSYDASIDEDDVAVISIENDRFDLLQGEVDEDDREISVEIDNLDAILAVVELVDYDLVSYPVPEGMDPVFFARDASEWAKDMVGMDMDQVLELSGRPEDEFEGVMIFEGFVVIYNPISYMAEVVSINMDSIFEGQEVRYIEPNSIYPENQLILHDYIDELSYVVMCYEISGGYYATFFYFANDINEADYGPLQFIELSKEPYEMPLDLAVSKFTGFSDGAYEAGLQIGEMTVITADDIDFGSGNMAYWYEFEGPITVTGRYYHAAADEMSNDHIYFSVDNDILPHHESHTGPIGFNIGPYDDIKSEFGPIGSSGTATIVIESFTYIFNYPSDVSSGATVSEIRNVEAD